MRSTRPVLVAVRRRFRRRRLSFEFRHFGRPPGRLAKKNSRDTRIMAFFSNQTSRPLIDSTATFVTQLKGQQEQWCAVVLAEEDLAFWSDCLKAVDLLRCPQVANSSEVTALLDGNDATALITRVSAAAGSDGARRLPAADSAAFVDQLSQAFSLLRDKRAAYDAHTDQLRTALATRQLTAEATVTAASPAPASNVTHTVTPERRQYFIGLVEKAVARTEYGSGSCRAIRAVDMPSTDLLYQIYTSLATARPALPAWGSLKIGREHSGAVLIPRKNGEPEGGPPPRCLQLMEFDVLCWALAITGAIFVSQGEQPGSFKYTLLADFLSRAAKDTPEYNAGAKACLVAGKLSLFQEVARDMRRFCEGDGREGATNYQTQALIKSFYARLSSALRENSTTVTLNQAVISLYEVGGADRLFELRPDQSKRDGKRTRQEATGGGSAGGSGGAGSSAQRSRNSGGRGGGRGGDGKKPAPKAGGKTADEAQAAFFALCKHHNLCSHFQFGRCKKEDCKFLHKLAKDV